MCAFAQSLCWPHRLMINFFFANKIQFSPILLLFRQVGSLIRQSLCSQVSGSPLESRRSDRTSSSLPFSSAKFKIAVSLSVLLERNAWQILAAVSSGGTLSSPEPFQVDDRRSCNGWYGRTARQSRVRIPATDYFRAETRNTSLKLCREADCTICSAKHADTD